MHVVNETDVPTVDRRKIGSRKSFVGSGFCRLRHLQKAYALVPGLKYCSTGAMYLQPPSRPSRPAGPWAKGRRLVGAGRRRPTALYPFDEGNPASFSIFRNGRGASV